MILVTGAGGTVGGEVVTQLRVSGVAVRAGYHSPEKAANAKAEGIDAVVIDFARPDTLAAALRGADKLFLVLGANPDQAELEIAAVAAAKVAGVAHIVKLSVWGAEDEAFHFARVHRAVEKEIEASGMTWTFIRPNGFMQNTVNYMGETIRSQGAFYESAADARISHVDVRDIAAVAVRVLIEEGHESKAYPLTGPEALTYAEVAEKLSAVTGKRITYVPIPDEAFKEGAIASGVLEWYADSLVDLQRYYRDDSASQVTEAVREVTGKAPISFDEFAREHAPAWQ